MPKQELKILITGLPAGTNTLHFKHEGAAADGKPIDPVQVVDNSFITLNDNSNEDLFTIINALARNAKATDPQSLSAAFSAEAGFKIRLILQFIPTVPPPGGGTGGNPGGTAAPDSLKPSGFIIPDALKLSWLIKSGRSDAVKFSDLIKDHYKIDASTPFFGEFPTTTGITLTNKQKADIVSNAISAVGGLDVTTFVDGLARFLVKRTKEELNSAFFERFRNLLQEPRYKDLKLVFPQTSQTLLALGDEIFNYEAYLTSLRTSFEKDLRTLPPHLSRWVDEGTFKTYFDGKPYLRSGLKSSLYFYDELSNGTHPGKAIEKFPLSTVAGVTIPQTVSTAIRIDSLAKIYIELSKSLQSGKGDRYWVTPDTIKALLDDGKARRFYLAMLFKNVKGIQYKTDETRVDASLVTTWDTKLDKASQFITHTKSLEEALKLARNLKNKDSLGYEYYSRFFDEFTQTVESGHQLVLTLIFNKDEAGPDSKFTKTVQVLRNVSELGLDVSRRKYGAAIVHAVQVYNYLTGDATLLDNQVTVGLLTRSRAKEIKFQWSDQPDVLVANLSNSGLEAVWDPASNRLGVRLPNEGENTIRAFPYPISRDVLMAALNSLRLGNTSLEASPVGEQEIQFTLPRWHRKRLVAVDQTSSVKEKAQDIANKLLMYGSFIATVAEADNSQEVADAIEAFALPAGSSSIKRKSVFNVSLNAYTGVLAGHESKGPAPYFNSYAVWAPVGISASLGRVNFGNWQNHSFSLLASIIDIGAVTAFRFTNDTIVSVPKIQLKDIIAPGLSVSWGIAKTPLSLAFGWQSAPFLRKVTTDANTTLDYRASRWHFTLAVDIPILNFYNRKYRKP
ncbi:hypothetical protein ACFPMF_12560 [Larkinella bovis]|uniref:Uncharacterized protein n=1 Tax=Larkinella bovis TaxID=683041 RepID=A0ABW0IC87_9BACT